MKILALLLLAVAVTARPQVGHHSDAGVQNQDHFVQVQQQGFRQEPVDEVESPVVEEDSYEPADDETNVKPAVKPAVAVTLPARVDDRVPPQQGRKRRQVPPRVPAQPVIQPQPTSDDNSGESEEEVKEEEGQQRPTRQAVEIQNKPFPLPEILPEVQPEDEDPRAPQDAQEFPIEPEEVPTENRFTRQNVPVAFQQQQQFEAQETQQRQQIVEPPQVIPQQFEQQTPQHFSTQQFEQQFAQQQFEQERQEFVPQQFEQPQVVRQDNRPQIAQEFPVEFDPVTGTLVKPQQPQAAVQGQEPIVPQKPQGVPQQLDGRQIDQFNLPGDLSQGEYRVRQAERQEQQEQQQQQQQQEQQQQQQQQYPDY